MPWADSNSAPMWVPLAGRFPPSNHQSTLARMSHFLTVLLFSLARATREWYYRTRRRVAPCAGVEAGDVTLRIFRRQGPSSSIRALSPSRPRWPLHGIATSRNTFSVPELPRLPDRALLLEVQR